MKSFLWLCLVHFSLDNPVNADCNRLRRQAICHTDPGSMFPVGIRLEKNFDHLLQRGFIDQKLVYLDMFYTDDRRVGLFF